MSIAPSSRYARPCRIRRKCFAFHQQAERVEMGAVFHLAVVEDDGIGTDVTPVSDSEIARLQDAVLEQMGLHNRVLVDAAVVSNSDEVEFDQPCRVNIDTFANLRAQQTEIERQ